MLFLVNDILDYAQFESKSLILNKEVFSISDLLENCLSILTFQAHGKGIDLLYEVEASAVEPVCSDSNRIRQILINLMSNAIKYTKKGHVKIVATKRSEETIEFRVEDTGVGIDRSDMESLFSKFTKI
jgi:signal transduction histidine kinase